jgi:hypothetical protein
MAFNGFVLLNGLDSVDGRGMAFIKRLGAVEPTHLRHGLEAVVGLGRQVGAGPRRHAARNPAAIKHRDFLAPARQLVSCGKAGYAGTNDNRIDPQIVGQGGRVRHHRVHPERAASFVCGIHGQPLFHKAGRARKTLLRLQAKTFDDNQNGGRWFRQARRRGQSARLCAGKL